MIPMANTQFIVHGSLLYVYVIYADKPTMYFTIRVIEIEGDKDRKRERETDCNDRADWMRSDKMNEYGFCFFFQEVGIT